MAIDAKAFFEESKRIKEVIGYSRDQADMIAQRSSGMATSTRR